MQVLKKINVLFLALLLSGCEQLLPVHSGRISSRSGFEQTGDISGRSTDTGDRFKTAMLLPLSGKASAYGQGLKNAAMMALEDADNPNLQIRFYDTGSTPAGAEEAARRALADGSKLILGPLMSEEVSAVSPAAQREDVPVISFSTSPAVLREGVYTLGLLGSEQVDRIIAYAAGQGRRRIAVLAPDSTAGMNTAKTAVESAAAHGAEVVRIGFYPPDTLDFGEIVKALTDYQTRSAEITQKKNLLSAQAKAGDRTAKRELNKLKTVYSTGSVDFDAVLIAESGNRLKSAASMFGYYDVAYPEVLFMGTSMWENTGLSKETTLYQAVYPVLSRVHNDYFNKKYQSLFGQTPNPLYSFAYDGVALASALSRKNPDALVQNITDADGYIGINGTFRIYENGTNRHSLDIVKITSDGAKIADRAPAKITSAPQSVFYTYQPGLTRPQIFGKDPQTVYRTLY